MWQGHVTKNVGLKINKGYKDYREINANIKRFFPMYVIEQTFCIYKDTK